MIENPTGWKKGHDEMLVQCTKCNTQIPIDMAIERGCSKPNCSPKYAPPVPSTINYEKVTHTFLRGQPDGPPSQKKILGIYNLKGDSNRLKAEYMSPPPPKPADAIRIVCISDTHEKETGFAKGFIPLGDILIHAGDFTYTGAAKAVDKFNKWLGSLPHKHKIVIAGNHDVTFDIDYYEEKWKKYHAANKQNPIAVKNSLQNCTYLEDSETTVEGLRIYGSPWQPEFCDWAFNVVGTEAIKKHWDRIPVGIDILITHGPPIRYGGICHPHKNDAGCPELLKAIDRTKPVLHVAGHIHEGYGVEVYNGVVLANASTVNFSYRVTNNAIVIDIAK